MRIVITRRDTLDVRDGINIFIFALADAFIRTGHEVTIVATTIGDESRIADLFGPREASTLAAVETRRPRFACEGLSPRWIARGPRMIRRLQPDLVINNGVLPFRTRGTSVCVAHDLGWASRSRRLDTFRRAYKRYAYAQCNQIVAVSSEVRDGISRQLSVPVERVLPIPPCIDVPAYEAARSSDREDAIVHAGTAAYKDPGATIRAFSALGPRSTKLYLVGEADVALGGQVANLPAETRDRIELVGELSAPRLRQLLGSVKVASFPTRYSVPAASATVVEAIATATPIAGSTTISTDLLRSGRNGFACDGDAELAQAFRTLLTDADRWSEMSRAASAMTPRFSADEVARSYLSLVEPLPYRARPVSNESGSSD